KRYFIFFILLSSTLFFSQKGFAQCIESFSIENIKDVSCKGGNDGEITVELVGGTAPFTYELVIPMGAAERPIASIVESYDRQVTFSLANAGELGIPANANYKVKVISSDVGSLACIDRLNIPDVVVSEPLEHLEATIDATDATCNGGIDGEAIANPTGGT